MYFTLTYKPEIGMDLFLILWNRVFFNIYSFFIKIHKISMYILLYQRVVIEVYAPSVARPPCGTLYWLVPICFLLNGTRISVTYGIIDRDEQGHRPRDTTPHPLMFCQKSHSLVFVFITLRDFFLYCLWVLNQKASDS